MQFDINQLKANTVHFRLVEESNAHFICELRSDPNLNKHISQTSTLVEEQKKWIRNYKDREKKVRSIILLFVEMIIIFLLVLFAYMTFNLLLILFVGEVGF